MRTVLVILFFLFNGFFSLAQKDSLVSPAYPVNNARLRGVIVSECAGYAATMAGLYQLWYKDFPLRNFHMFNDNSEWLQMDKAGHMTTAYYIGKHQASLLKWAGMTPRNAARWAAATGFFFLSSVETLDGLSPQWGFSFGDMAANMAGSLFFLGQDMWWQEQRMQLKFSFHQTSYAKYRPAVLGSTLNEQVLKDYNGQTYWLAANISMFLPSRSSFPKWLSLAIGYGADGMTGGHTNPATSENGSPIPSFSRMRQFYLAPDIDLSKIHTRSKALNLIFQSVGFIKFPLPAAEFNKHRVTLHPVCF